jgi:hypothetical protein
MEELDSPTGDWELLRTGRRQTELIVDSESSATTWGLLLGLVLMLYGIGFFFFPLPSFSQPTATALALLGTFFCLLRVFFSDTILWDLINKRAYRVMNFAGSKWVKRTYEGDEVFMVVVEAAAGEAFGLSMVTRFGHRYQVLPAAYERELVTDDAQTLARYFNVSVKEGTPGVVPYARASKSPILKWKKRPKNVLRSALLLVVLLVPLAVHVAGPLLR